MAKTGCEPARKLQAKIGRARDQLLTFCDYPGEVDVTNNTSERKLRPCVLQRKVTNGYRAMWAAKAEADLRTTIDTARLKGANPKLLIVDELGYLPLEPDAAHLFFQLVSRRYERGAMLITSNRAVGEWGSVFGDAVVATAILDRLLHHSRRLLLTTDANAVVAPIHPKAMPVILTTVDEFDIWLTAPAEEALVLQRPLPDDALRIVARGERSDRNPA